MASPPPPKTVRPVTLKLKTPGAVDTAITAPPASSITSAPIVATPGAMSPPPATPGGGMKIILKRAQLPPPAAVSNATATPASATVTSPSVTMTQKGRVSKPTAKKRAHDHDDSDDEPVAPAPARRALPSSAPRPAVASRGADSGGPSKRPKLILKTSAGKARMASIVLKQTSKEAPPHSRGEGYDSEEEDREIDPVIEEEFVLRMPPGEHCDYLRRMVEERKIGVPVKDGGADFHLRWLAGGSGTGAVAAATINGAATSSASFERRALVTVHGQHFVGVLVDLPTITEAMKSWDKRNFMKSADVCQMLLVFAAVADEAEAKSRPLPPMVSKDYRWPHGLTPPMHDCIHRRFRKRLSKKEIKDKEAELQRLLNEDRLAVETRWKLIDDDRVTEPEMDADGAEEGEEDAYGDVNEDYFGRAGGDADVEGDADAEGEIDEAELMAEFMEEDEEGGDDSGAGDGEVAVNGAAATGHTTNGGVKTATDAAAAVTSEKISAAAAKVAAHDEEDDEEEEEDDEDEDDEDDLDEDAQARAEQAKGVREDILDLKKNLQMLDAQLAATTNALLRKRIEGTRKRVLSELRLKQASIGEIDEEE